MPVDDLAVASNQARNLEPELADRRAHAIHGGIILARISWIFDELRRETLIRLVPTSNGYRGWPTQAGIEMVRRGLKMSEEPVANASSRSQEAKSTTNLNPAANLVPESERGATRTVESTAELPT